MTKPVVVHRDSDTRVITTPWGDVEVDHPVPDPVPGKPGHVKAGHLIFFPSDIFEELLAAGKMVYGSDGYYLSATTDGGRKFIHVWAVNGHWVWVLHEVRFNYVDKGWNRRQTAQAVVETPAGDTADLGVI